MKQTMETFITTHDAQLLRALLGRLEQSSGKLDLDLDLEALGNVLDEAQVVDVLPGRHVVLGSHVRYIESTTGMLRGVTLVLPRQADIDAGRISVLSPTGRALLGKAPGHRGTIVLPGGRQGDFVIAEVTPQTVHHETFAHSGGG